ncbi:hypothetical protein MMC22_002026 [Lobaria immixta]|nr:hypothetical protein [Lobaria immixta]
MSGFFADAIVNVEKKDGKYSVKQIQRGKALPLPVQRREVEQVTGYFDTKTLEIGVEVLVLGIILGSFYGNLKDGVMINFNLKLAKGSSKFYLKNGNKLCVRINIDVIFDSLYY